MVTTSEIRVEAEIEELIDKKPMSAHLKTFWHQQPLGAVGGIIVVAMVVMAVFADFLAPYDPELNAFEHMLVSPNGDFWLGTDQFGRDMLSRLIHGARTALFVGFTSAFIGAFTGLVLGVGSAYFGGKIDLIFQRIMDVFMAFPLIIMALAVVAIFGPGIQNVKIGRAHV